MGLIKRTVRRKIKTPAKRAMRQKVTKPARKKIERATSVKCGTCGKRYTNPMAHTCVVETDFAKRKAVAERKAKADAARRKRREAAERKRAAARARKKAAADRRKAAAAERRRRAAAKRSAPARRTARPAHDYRTCRDEDCRRMACRAYKEGDEAGYWRGFPDGQMACTREHV